ncbi:cyclase family protein [Luteolibacter algae]|uniref:Cyclase family protein n=1 Tax=Luteolibacter algae TaxID=454151 RepID=A0ABW5D8I5_9BACT
MIPTPIDLTMPLTAGMRGVSYEEARSIEKDGWNARTLHIYSHAGTHMDAQTHFGAGEETIDLLPLDRCIGPAWVVRLPGLSPGTLLTVAHLGGIAEKFRNGDSLLFHTGWSAFLEETEIYRDGLPRISEELARWCVEREVKILGVEPPSVADVNNLPELTLIHEILLSAKVTIVEGLTNLEKIPGERCDFGAFPLRISGGDGCPCRAVAWPES